VPDQCYPLSVDEVERNADISYQVPTHPLMTKSDQVGWSATITLSIQGKRAFQL
jgi:hypothetical protein